LILVLTRLEIAIMAAANGDAGMRTRSHVNVYWGIRSCEWCHCYEMNVGCELYKLKGGALDKEERLGERISTFLSPVPFHPSISISISAFTVSCS
jgi:hypothetical protein